MNLRYDILVFRHTDDDIYKRPGKIVYSSTDINLAKNWITPSNLCRESVSKLDRFKLIPFDERNQKHLSPIQLDEVGNTSISAEDCLSSDQ